MRKLAMETIYGNYKTKRANITKKKVAEALGDSEPGPSEQFPEVNKSAGQQIRGGPEQL